MAYNAKVRIKKRKAYFLNAGSFSTRYSRSWLMMPEGYPSLVYVTVEERDRKEPVCQSQKG